MWPIGDLYRKWLLRYGPDCERTGGAVLIRTVSNTRFFFIRNLPQGLVLKVPYL